jgi:peptide/nickel transport system substrate-binding protein
MARRIALWRIACLLFLAAAPPCGAAEDVPVPGDALVIGMLGEPVNLIPALSSDSASHEVAAKLFVSLLKYDKDIKVIPWAAESYELLDGGLRLRFTLRKGILWEDGVELTADDVEFTYRMMIDPATPTAYGGDFKAVQSFARIDRYNVEIAYAKPFARALDSWMQEIMPRHIMEGQDLRSTALARKPLGCGPYILQEWQPGARLTLAANPGYFEGRPHIDRVICRIIPDITTMFLELTSGGLDVMGSLSPLQYLARAKEPAFAAEYGVYRSLASAYVYLGYNLHNPLFSDRRVRLAIAHALNKQDIVKGALLGQGEPAIGPYKPDSWAYNRAIRDYPHDIDEARRLLAEAGWKKNADGVLAKDGKPFAFTMLVNQGNEVRIKTAVIIQAQLKELGIRADIRTLEWAAFLNRVSNQRLFDAVILAWTIPQNPDAYDVWHSSSAAPGKLNFVGFANPEADALLERARFTFDQDERKRLYDRFQEILHQEQPYSFLYVPYSLAAVQKRFRGIEPAPAGIFHNTNTWWVPLADQRYRLQP